VAYQASPDSSARRFSRPYAHGMRTEVSFPTLSVRVVQQNSGDRQDIGDFEVGGLHDEAPTFRTGIFTPVGSSLISNASLTSQMRQSG
jgi:hypothetical protein